MQQPPVVTLESMIAAVMGDSAKLMPTVVEQAQSNWYQ